MVRGGAKDVFDRKGRLSPRDIVEPVFAAFQAVRPGMNPRNIAVKPAEENDAPANKRPGDVSQLPRGAVFVNLF
jgi:hypothetical protein